MNIIQRFNATVQRRGHHPALHMDGVTLSYRELREAVNNLAAGLADAGIRPGQRVCLFLPNCPEFVMGYLALVQLGAVAVSVNSTSKEEELRHIANDSQAVSILTRCELLGTLPRPADMPTVRLILAEEARGPARSYTDMLRRPCPRLAGRELERDAPAAILYTSGTTGKPKGAVLSHGNVLASMKATHESVGMREDDRILCFLPFFHCFGQNVIMNAALAAGATLYVQRRFLPGEALAAAERYAITLFFGVPTVYTALLHQPRATEQLRSVRYYFSAAAPLPTEVERVWHERTGIHIHEGYGLTETSPCASHNHIREWRPGSVGSPVEGVEMCIMDEQGQRLPDGALGEICIKGPNVMLGYFNRPEETAKAIVEGWLRSGDIGYRDADGYYYLVDRVKDMINAAGFKVWPREVEEVLFRHPKVKESAVIGVPDAYRGEAVKAFVVLKAGAQATSAELQAHCREHLSNYKVPRDVELTDSIPKGVTGKLLKRQLRLLTHAAPTGVSRE
jgi:long-chain acyl-CoA synthetase